MSFICTPANSNLYDMSKENILIVKGIVKRASVSKISKKFDKYQIKSKVLVLSPILYLISNRKKNDPIKKDLISNKAIAIIKLATRKPTLCIPYNWACFEIYLEYPLSHQVNQNILNIQLGEDLKIHISRDVARFGVPSNNLSNTLEYELARQIQSFDLVLSQANLKISNARFKSFCSSLFNRFLPYSLKLRKMLPILDKSYFNELLLKDINLGINVNNVYVGRRGEHIKHENRLTIGSNYVFCTLTDAKILHGQVIFKDNKFYFSDVGKIPGLNDYYNFWPSYLYQKELDLFLSVPCRKDAGKIHEAIFIGGINNWMHFVMEDLPKIIEIDNLNLNMNIPIILKKGLSHQIIECIKKLTPRELIFLSEFEALEVNSLHYFESKNGLIHSKSKSRVDYDSVFSTEIIRIMRSKLFVDGPSKSKKLLIKREAGLFRPLVNHSKIEKILVDKYGFIPIYLNSMSLSDIQQLFSTAAIVVGEYGAGLANMIFMPRGSHLLELRGPLEQNHYEYESLGNVLALNYSVILGSNRKVSRYGLMSGPYMINTRELLHTIASLPNLSPC